MDDLRFKALRAKLLRRLWDHPDAKPRLATALAAVGVDLDGVLHQRKLPDAKLEAAAVAVAPELLPLYGLAVPRDPAECSRAVLTWRVFVAWDMSDATYRFLLEVAEQQSKPDARTGVAPLLQIDAALGGHSVGVAEKVRNGIRRADRVVAIVDEHNANVAYEVGFALGSGIPVSFGSKAEKPGSPWTLRRPNKDLIVGRAREIAELLAIATGDDATEPPPRRSGARGAACAWLCPGKDPAGSAARRRLPELRKTWTALDPDEWLLLELPRVVEIFKRLVWIITPSDAGRDGPENTDNGIIAGFVDALGGELEVLQMFIPPSGRRILDVGVQAREWSALPEFEALVLAIPEGPPATLLPRPDGTAVESRASRDPAVLLATWRSLVRESHALLGGRHARLVVEQAIPLYAEASRCDDGDDKADGSGSDASHGRRRAPIAKDSGGGMGEPGPKEAGAASATSDLDAFRRALEPGTLREIIDRIPEEAPPWILLLGGPGAGKTTTCRRLVWELADNPHGPIGVFASLVRWIGGRNPFDLAAEDLGDAAGADEKTAFVQLLRNAAEKPRRVWLFLDGWDEVVDAAQRKAIRGALAAFTKSHPGVVVVVTSRRTGYDRSDFPVGFREWSLLRLSPADQRRFLELRLPAHAAALLRGIAEVPLLRDLAGTPLVLGLLADLVQAGVVTPTSLPRRRVELFREAVSCLLERGQSDLVSGVAAPDAAAELLGRLSLRLQHAGGESWPGHELIAHLRSLQADPSAQDEVSALLSPWGGNGERFLNDVARSSGILAPAGDAANRRQPWSYLHKSFRESLAAERLAASGDREVAALLHDLAKQSTDSKHRGDGHLSDRAAWIARFGETLSFLVGSVPGPRGREIVAELAKVESSLAFRALAEVVELGIEAGLELFFSIAGGDGDSLRDGLEAWCAPLDLEAAIDAVLAWVAERDKAASAKARGRKGPASAAALSVEQHAFVLYALEHVVRRRQPADSAALEALRRRFFAAMPRWASAKAPELRRLRVPRVGDTVVFLMGSSKGEGHPDERPQHPVTLSPFELSVVPVTCDTYRPFDASADDSAARKGHPVTGVSWWDAWLFSRWVGGRLPTEAEWECACRAGTTTPWSTGSRETSLGQGAWYSANSKGTTHPVGTKAPNSWGFHDLHGNVWEWCADRFGPYPESPQRDPTGPASGAHRVLRGGGYWDVAVWCRSAYRGNWRPGFRDADHGFRVAFPAFPPSLVNLEPSSFED